MNEMKKKRTKKKDRSTNFGLHACAKKEDNYNDNNNNNFITYIAQITSAYDQMRITYKSTSHKKL